MANGDMGKKASPELKQRGLALIDKQNTIQQVAKRLGVSESLVRNWVRERPQKAPDVIEEPEITDSV